MNRWTMFSSRACFAAVAAMALVVVIAGRPAAADAYSPNPALTADALPSTQKIVPNIGGDIATTTDPFEIEGLRDEWTSFQILIRTEGPAGNVNVTMSDLQDDASNVIPAQAFTLYREWFLNVTEPSGGGWAVSNHLREPGLYPDPLIPFIDPYSDGALPVAAPFDLDGDTFGLGHGLGYAVVWVDLHIPADATPGVYLGTAHVTADGFHGAAVHFSVQVWELDMPHEMNVGTAYGLCEGCIRSYHGGTDGGATDADYPEIVRNYYKALHENRIDVTTTAGPMTYQFDGDGNLLPVDWDAYDAFMLPRIDGTYFDDTAGIARFNAGMFAPGNGTHDWGDEQYKQAARAYVEHLDEKGWLDMMWTYSTDEPWLNGGEETWNRVIREAGLLHDASPLWEGHVLVTGPMYAGAEDVVDIWCPVNPMYDKWFWFDMDYAGRGDYDEHMANNGELWFYNCNGNFPPYPGYDIDTTIGYEPRILKWGSWFEKATGFLHWGLNIWGFVEPWTIWQSRDVFGELFARNGDGLLIYPGDSNGTLPTAGTPDWLHIDGPIMSYRMKQIRDGLEDWELFIMAEKAGIGDWVRNEMGRAYTRFGDFFVEDCTQEHHYCPAKGEPWTLDQYVMLDVRTRIIRKLLFTMYPDRYDDPDVVDIPEVTEAVEAVEVVEIGGDAIDPGDTVETDVPVANDAVVSSDSATDTAVTDIATDTGTGDDTESRHGGGCSSTGSNPAFPFAILIVLVSAALILRRRGQME